MSVFKKKVLISSKLKVALKIIVLTIRKSLQCYGAVLSIMLFYYHQPLPHSYFCAEPTVRIRIFRA